MLATPTGSPRSAALSAVSSTPPKQNPCLCNTTAAGPAPPRPWPLSMWLAAGAWRTPPPKPAWSSPAVCAVRRTSNALCACDSLPCFFSDHSAGTYKKPLRMTCATFACASSKRNLTPASHPLLGPLVGSTFCWDGGEGYVTRTTRPAHHLGDDTYTGPWSDPAVSCFPTHASLFDGADPPVVAARTVTSVI